MVSTLTRARCDATRAVGPHAELWTKPQRVEAWRRVLACERAARRRPDRTPTGTVTRSKWLYCAFRPRGALPVTNYDKSEIDTANLRDREFCAVQMPRSPNAKSSHIFSLIFLSHLVQLRRFDWPKPLGSKNRGERSPMIVRRRGSGARAFGTAEAPVSLTNVRASTHPTPRKETTARHPFRPTATRANRTRLQPPRRETRLPATAPEGNLLSLNDIMSAATSTAAGPVARQLGRGNALRAKTKSASVRAPVRARRARRDPPVRPRRGRRRHPRSLQEATAQGRSPHRPRRRRRHRRTYHRASRSAAA